MKKGYWVVAYRSISDASAVKAYGALARRSSAPHILEDNDFAVKVHRSP